MKRIFVVKPLSGNPADGIDNVNIAVFGRIPKERVTYVTEAPSGFVERGAIVTVPQEHGLLSLVRRILYMRRVRPDIIVGIGTIADILFALLRPRGTQYVILWHTVLFRGSEAWNVRTPWFIRAFIFHRADVVLCPSVFSAASVKKYFPQKKVISILNGVDTELFNPKKKNESYIAEKYAVDFSRPVVAFVGSLHARKRPDLFVSLAAAMPEAQFVAVGRATPEFDIVAAARDLTNFQWIPSMPREDVAIFLASSAAFVFPSLHDAAAAVNLEAMASGSVPVVSASGGNGEFFKNGESGFLISVGASERDDFLATLRRLLSDDSLRETMSRAARAEAERHTWDVVAKQYEDTIGSL